MPKCRECGRELIPVEIALTKKLINRGAESFFCKGCLSVFYGVSERKLDEMVEQFIAQGCALFVTE